MDTKPIPAEEEELLSTYEPKSPLGQRLWELRQKIVASREVLLNAEGVEREV